MEKENAVKEIARIKEFIVLIVHYAFDDITKLFIYLFNN